MLQLGNGVRRPHVVFAAHAIGVFAAGVERVREHRIAAERRLVYAHRFFGDLEYADAFNVRSRAGEVLVDQRARQADRLENLCARVRHVSRNAHLGHDFAQALADRLDEILDRLFAVSTGTKQVPLRSVKQRFQCEVRMHRFRAIAAEQREMMDFAR